MADVPIYQSKVGAPNVGSLSIAPVQVPDLHSGEGLSQGAQEFGQALLKYAAFKKTADETVRTNTAMTGYITGLDQAETQAAQSPDWQNAPQDFHKKAEELSQKAIADANLDPADRSALELRLRSLSISSGGRVNAAALGKQVDVATAARGQQAIALSRAAAAASSPVERQTMIEQQLSTIDRNVKAGLLSADKAEAEKQAFLKSTDDQLIRQTIRTDPMAAKAMLADPSRFKGMSGSEIETYRAQAETAADQAQKDHLLGLATGSKPEQASLAMNKALTPQQADAIYDHGIIQIEHGGRPLYLGGAGGGGRLRSAPAGTPALSPNDPSLAPVHYAGGTFMVDRRYQVNFQGFIRDYEAAGGVIGPNSGTLGERPNNGSYHPIGAAIDINQTGRGVRGGGRTLPLALEDQLATKWGLRSGNHFSNNDNGHFDAGGSGGGDGGITGPVDMTKASLEVSEAGAIGLGQLMPDTARELAAKVNLTAAGKPVSQMSNAEITDYLRVNPEINRKLGLIYWHESLDAFDQNIALAAAGYNAGIGKAKEYQAAAIAKYGPDATPMEIAQVIGEGSPGLKPNKQTHDYVLKLFGAMNVPPTGPGVSPGARYQTTGAVQAVVDKQQTEAERIIKEQAALDRATGGDDMDLMKKGIVAWTPQFETIYQHNVQAAAAGSTDAAAFVTQANTGREAKPWIDAAWRMPPPRLDDEVTRLGALAAAGGATHAELVQLAAFKAVQTEIGNNAKTDPVGLAARAGYYATQSLDPNAAPDDPGFLQSLAVRGVQATRAAAIYNTLAPLRPKEVDALKQRFAEAGVPEQLALLNAFSQTLSPRAYKAAIDQLGLDPATATAGRFAPDDPALAKKILIGESYRKGPGAEKLGATLTAAAADTLGGNIYPLGSPAFADTLTAVENVYLANRGPDALFKPPDGAAMKAAITEVVGELTDIHKRPTPAPPGISASRFEELFDHLTDEQLATVGRAVNPRVPGLNQVVDVAGRPVTADEITAHAVLTQRVPRGAEYFVGDAAGNGYFHEDGSPLVLDFRALDATAAHAAAADSAAAARAHSAAATAAAAATPVSETRRTGAGALFGDQPLGGVEVAPAPAPAAPEPIPAEFVKLLNQTPETTRHMWDAMTPQQKAPYLEGRSLVPSLTPGVPGEGR